MTEPNPHALTGAYALDALDGAELAQFEAHLAECDSCPSEAAELRATASRLSSLVERNPPPELRERVLRAANRTPQLPPLPVSLADRRASSRRRIYAATGGALAIAAVTAGTLFVVTGDDIPSADQIVAAADAHTVTLAAGDTNAELTISASLDAAVLHMAALDPPPPGQTYQAWIIEGDDVIPSDVFEPDSSGSVTEVLADADAATEVGVTLEPDGGSTVPSAEPLMLFELDA